MTPKITAKEIASVLNMTLQGLHKKVRTNEKLDFLFSGRRAYATFDECRNLLNIAPAHQVIAVQSAKGGVGKSTISKALSCGLNRLGLRVLHIDADSQANSSLAFNIKNPDVCLIDILNGKASIKDGIIKMSAGLDLLASRLDNALLDQTIILQQLPLDRCYSAIFETIKAEYDSIIIDCPPSIGQHSTGLLLSSDMVISPVAPEEYSLSGLSITYNEVMRHCQNYSKDIDFRVLINKFDGRTNLSLIVSQMLSGSDLYRPNLLKAIVRNSQAFPNSVMNKESIFTDLRKTPAKEDIHALCLEILGLDMRDAEQNIELGSLETNPEEKVA